MMKTLVLLLVGCTAAVSAHLLASTRTGLARSRLVMSDTRKTFTASEFPPEWPYTASDLARADESSDGQFYATPRFVTHIDDGAIAALRAYYGRELQQGSDLLDVCSSWISHLPDTEFGRVAGVGMNARELSENAALTEFVRADLNEKPELPFASSSFDTVLCVVSIDYLNQPQAVVAEMHRVLRPGGRALLSFSNRCFPTKAIRMWLQANDEQRQRIVASYFMYAPAGGWTDVGAERLPAVEAAATEEATAGGAGGFLGGLFNLDRTLSQLISSTDPMYVVSATKV